LFHKCPPQAPPYMGGVFVSGPISGKRQKGPKSAGRSVPLYPQAGRAVPGKNPATGGGEGRGQGVFGGQPGLSTYPQALRLRLLTNYLNNNKNILTGSRTSPSWPMTNGESRRVSPLRFATGCYPVRASGCYWGPNKEYPSSVHRPFIVRSMNTRDMIDVSSRSTRSPMKGHNERQRSP